MKELYCITCPAGCRLEVTRNGAEITVAGNGCKRGVDFARTELTNPTRSLTTTVRTVFPGVPVLPVRTAGEIPKGKMMDAMRELATVTIQKPVSCGEVVLENLAGSGISVIATSDALVNL